MLDCLSAWSVLGLWGGILGPMSIGMKLVVGLGVKVALDFYVELQLRCALGWISVVGS